MSEKKCRNCYSQFKEDSNTQVCPVCGYYEIIDLRKIENYDTTAWLESQ